MVHYSHSVERGKQTVMLFTSLRFVIFFIFLFLAYYIIPQKYRWMMLLVASYLFYMNLHVGYGILLFMTTVLTYVLGLKIDACHQSAMYIPQDNLSADSTAGQSVCQDVSKRDTVKILLSGIIPLTFILVFYKTAGPAIEILNNAISVGKLTMQPITLRIVLPAGISFYFFQSMGYLIDVYRGKIKAEKHFGYYALFVSFFPQLLAGPIGRADSLLPQYKEERSFNYAQVSYGLRQIAWGYFKKLVIADVFATVVDKIYNDASNYVGFVFIIVTVMFAFEIYCDFSGYSDIAIGCAKMLGIDLMTNFKSPYCSFSIKEFWSRWHISLSTWFRDYVYIPLGGNRKGNVRRDINLMITFLVSGFWHGSSLTYIFWGGLHGLLQIAENRILPAKRADGTKIERKKHWWQWPVTFALICVTWVFFRANSLHDVIWIFSHAFDTFWSTKYYLKLALICLELPYITMAGMFLSAAFLMFFDILSLKMDVIETVGKLSFVKRYAIYICLLVVIVLFSNKGIATEFIYFQF